MVCRWETLHSTASLRNRTRLTGTSYLDNLPRIASDSYLATDQDILALPWTQTTGVYGRSVDIGNQAYHIYDVGGTEHRKWPYAYDETDCVMIVVSLSSYNESHYEDPNMASSGDVVLWL